MKLRNEELNRLSETEYKKAGKLPVTVVLDNVRSMHNVGAVFRTCDAFLISKIYLSGFTPTPPHRDIHKTALGATNTVNWEYAESTEWLLTELKDQNHFIVGVEQTKQSVPLDELSINYSEKLVLVFGNEVEGISDQALELCDQWVEVSQYGTKHSLNLAVCAGIVLWKFCTSIKK